MERAETPIYTPPGTNPPGLLMLENTLNVLDLLGVNSLSEAELSALISWKTATPALPSGDIYLLPFGPQEYDRFRYRLSHDLSLQASHASDLVSFVHDWHGIFGGFSQSPGFLAGTNRTTYLMPQIPGGERGIFANSTGIEIPAASHNDGQPRSYTVPPNFKKRIFTHWDGLLQRNGNIDITRFNVVDEFSSVEIPYDPPGGRGIEYRWMYPIEVASTPEFIQRFILQLHGWGFLADPTSSKKIRDLIPLLNPDHTRSLARRASIIRDILEKLKFQGIHDVFNRQISLTAATGELQLYQAFVEFILKVNPTLDKSFPINFIEFKDFYIDRASSRGLISPDEVEALLKKHRIDYSP